ncbi:MAG: hypothetical protein WB564_03135 [Dehalococcoidia bacterium]
MKKKTIAENTVKKILSRLALVHRSSVLRNEGGSSINIIAGIR